MFYGIYNTAGYFDPDYSEISGVELNDLIFALYLKKILFILVGL